jgi:hypothetical protein
MHSAAAMRSLRRGIVRLESLRRRSQALKDAAVVAPLPIGTIIKRMGLLVRVSCVADRRMAIWAR